MINKGIEVGSTVELDPKFDKQERTKGRLQWLKAKKLCFGARYIVVEKQLTHLPCGQNASLLS